MGYYVIRRSLQGLLTLYLITVAVFFVLRAGGGNPLDYMLPPESDRGDRDRLTAYYGFDKPLIQQYWKYNKNLFQGDLGRSMGWDKRPTLELVWDRLPATLQLSGLALVFSVVVGSTAGALSAARPDSVIDRFARVLAIAGQSMPIFWVGILLILLFAVTLQWLPSAGGIDRVGWKGIILPALSLSGFLVASHMRIVRSTMIEVLESDYITMARAKGLPSRLVIWKHAFKNAAIPVFTLFFINFAHLISGAVVTESIFSWPGIGRLLINSIIIRDYPTTQAVIFFAAAFILIVNIFVDVMYAWLDPRIRVGR